MFYQRYLNNSKRSQKEQLKNKEEIVAIFKNQKCPEHQQKGCKKHCRNSIKHLKKEHIIKWEINLESLMISYLKSPKIAIEEMDWEKNN